jgi:acetone carboxylase gamma subunit
MKNKYQEALDNLVHCKSITRCKECKHKNLCTMERDSKILQELVDKETPKKLSEVKIQYSIEIPAYMVVKTCPKCNRKFDNRNMGVNYCSICGQHLDWSE